MKKLISLIAVTILLSSFVDQAIAGEEEYANIRAQHYVQFLSTLQDRPIRINYDEEEGHFIFYIMESIGLVGFIADTGFVASLVQIVDKYDEWNTKAIIKEVEIDKEIRTLKTGVCLYKLGDDWHGMYPINVSFKFFSQSTKRHQLILSFDKMKSMKNQYVDHKPDALYFDYEEAIELRDIFTDAHFKKWLADLQKQRMIDSDFN